jgi:hypothetical protein
MYYGVFRAFPVQSTAAFRTAMTPGVIPISFLTTDSDPWGEKKIVFVGGEDHDSW